LEVLAPDRLGLLYSLASSLNRLGLNIAFAKLATEKAMAFDVFYLTDPSTGKIAEDRWDDILSAIDQVLQAPSAAAAGPRLGAPRR
jgi:UTP:GlnB (protein PII) uridylyltransferase